MKRGTGFSRRDFLKGLSIGAAVATGEVSLLRTSLGQEVPKVRMGSDFPGVPFWAYLQAKRAELLPKGYDVSFQILDDLLLIQAFLEKRVELIVALAYNMPRVWQRGRQITFFIPLAWFKGGYFLVVKKDRPYQKLEDLFGKKVAYASLGEDERVYFESMFYRTYKKRLGEVFKGVETDQIAQAVELDQAEGAVVGIEAWGKLARTGNYRILVNTRNLWEKITGRPGELLIQGGYAADPEFISRHNDFIELLIDVHLKMWQAYKANPEEFIKVCSAQTGFPPPVMKIIVDNFGLNDLPPDKIYLSRQDIEDHRLLFEMIRDIGVYDVPPVEKMFYISKKAPRRA